MAPSLVNTIVISPLGNSTAWCPSHASTHICPTTCIWRPSSTSFYKLPASRQPDWPSETWDHVCADSPPSHHCAAHSLGGPQALQSMAGFLSDLTFSTSLLSLPPATLAFLLCLKHPTSPSSRSHLAASSTWNLESPMSPSFPHSHCCMNIPDSVFPFPTLAFIKWHSNTLFPLSHFTYFSNYF